MVTTVDVRHAKIQSNLHHQQINTQLFTGRMPFLFPNQQCHSTERETSEGLSMLMKITNFVTREGNQPWCTMVHKVHEYMILWPTTYTSDLTNELKGSVKEPNTFHNYEMEKITGKVSVAAENLQLYRVVRFFCPRSLCMTTHLMLFSEHLQIYVPCNDDLGWKNQTTRYNCRFSASAVSLALRVIFIRQKPPPIYASCMTMSGR